MEKYKVENIQSKWRRKGWKYKTVIHSRRISLLLIIHDHLVITWSYNFSAAVITHGQGIGDPSIGGCVSRMAISIGWERIGIHYDISCLSVHVMIV